MDFHNVKESWFLYDTVLISPWIDNLPSPVSGWFATFAALGAADNVTFFNSRNKSIGLAYNNQESRDQVPFALVAKSLSVTFIAPTVASHRNPAEIFNAGRVDWMPAFWEAEIPQHVSVIFRVNQDERLKTNCLIIPPGYGPVGMRQGQGDLPSLGGFNGTANIGGQGRAHLKFRWEFPTGIGIPRRATLAVIMHFTEWARTFLQNMWGPGNMQVWEWDNLPMEPKQDVTYRETAFEIQCCLTGVREVQQRGEYHA